MITVKGVHVRVEELSEEIHIDFEDLTEEGQKRVFLENQEDFILDALESKFPNVRRLLWEPEVLENCSPFLLNKAIAQCCFLKNREVEDIKILINTLGSKLDKGIIEFIAVSPFVEIELKVLVVQNEKISLKNLKEKAMFQLATLKVIEDNDFRLFDAIVKNPKFDLCWGLERVRESFSFSGFEMIASRIKELKCNC